MGKKVGTVADFILEGSKITADGDCSHEIKRYLLLGRKAVTNLVNILILLLLLFCFTVLYWFCHTSEHIKKQRHHFADKGPYKQSYVFFPPSICHEVMGLKAMILAFWMLSFKPAFLLSSFTFIRRLFSSSSLFATRVVSSAYLRLLIFLPAISISAC